MSATVAPPISGQRRLTLLTRLIWLALLVGLMGQRRLEWPALRIEPAYLGTWLMWGVPLVWLTVTICMLVRHWRRGRGTPRRVAIGIVGLLACLMAIGTIRQWDHLMSLVAARAIYRGYDITVDDRTKTLSIVGAIGPDLGHRVRVALATHPILTVQIDSIGGLVGESLQAADAIDGRGNMTVVASGQCASACLPILFAGYVRLADATLTLGFHAPSLAAPGLESAKAVETEAADYYDFLAKHYVSDRIIRQIKATGPGKLYEVPAVELVESGALTAALVGDDRVPLPLAKWIYVENSAAAYKRQPSLPGLLAAIRTTEPDVAERLGDAIYDERDSNFWLDPVVSFRNETDRLRKISPDSAEPVVAFRHLQAYTRELSELRDLKYDRACEQLALLRGGSLLRTLPAKLIDAETRTLTAEIRSAARAHWAPRPISPDAEDNARRILATTRISLAADGVRMEDTDERSVCMAQVRVDQELVKLDPVAAIDAERWLEHNRWPGPERQHL